MDIVFIYGYLLSLFLVLSNQAVHGFHLDGFLFYPTKQFMAIT